MVRLVGVVDRHLGILWLQWPSRHWIDGTPSSFIEPRLRHRPKTTVPWAILFSAPSWKKKKHSQHQFLKLLTGIVDYIQVKSDLRGLFKGGFSGLIGSYGTTFNIGSYGSILTLALMGLPLTLALMGLRLTLVLMELRLTLVLMGVS